jgi:lipopolysaccharide biosynthesis glycosyltransferase
MKNLGKKHNNSRVKFVKVPDSTLSSVPTPKWFNEGIYYRLLINSLLPLEDENILYIDCDTIIDGSLTEIFELNMDNHVAAGVPEPINKSFWIGLPADVPFYNTGVMYINLEKWEEHNIEERSMKYIEKNKSLVLPLQQILNTLLHEDSMWRSVSPKYNAMIGGWIGTNESKEFGKKIEPIIIHYFGPKKPWEYMYDKPYSDKWWTYLKQTPYEEFEPDGKNWKTKIVKSLADTLKAYPKIHDIVRCIYQ